MIFLAEIGFEQFGLFASHSIRDRDDFVGNNYALSRHIGLAGRGWLPAPLERDRLLPELYAVIDQGFQLIAGFLLLGVVGSALAQIIEDHRDVCDIALILLQRRIITAQYVAQSRPRSGSNRRFCLAEKLLHLMSMRDQALAFGEIEDRAIDQYRAYKQQADGYDEGNASCQAAQHRHMHEPLAHAVGVKLQLFLRSGDWQQFIKERRRALKSPHFAWDRRLARPTYELSWRPRNVALGPSSWLLRLRLWRRYQGKPRGIIQYLSLLWRELTKAARLDLVLAGLWRHRS